MPYDLRLRTPFNMMISGPSQSGKTTFLYQLLKASRELFMEPPERIVLFYAINQPIYERMKHEGVIHELYDIAKVKLNFDDVKNKMSSYSRGAGSVIIFDDVMSFMNDIPRFDSFFTVLGHHIKCSLIFIVQNFYYKNPVFRTISINFKLLVLKKNPRDSSQIGPIAYQVCPGDTGFVKFAYHDATKNPYGYLVIDCSNDIDDNLRLRSNIFIDNDVMFPDNPYKIYLKDKMISIF